jgi:modification methylase
MFHPDTPEEYRNQIVTGDARILAERIPDASVDLIFADPVYERIDDYRWLAETAMRVLKPDSACLVYCGIGLLPQTHDALRAGGLAYKWRLITRPVNSKEFYGRLLITTQECLWYEKGHSKLQQSIFDFDLSTTKGMYDVAGSNWGKGRDILLRYINTFSAPCSVVYDPFTGGGTVPAVCKMLGRNFIASEIDPETADRARLRLEQTQPPLFVLSEEQASMELTSLETVV